MLGTAGRRTGRYFTGLDDFTVITPGFETYLSLTTSNSSSVKRGSFPEVALNKNRIKKDYYNLNPYTAYNRGGDSIMQYRNEIAPIDKRILAIGDSFATVPFAFLPLIFTSCNQLDLRYCDEDFDFQEYFNSYNPDIVINLANPTTLTGPNLAYDFFNEYSDKSFVREVTFDSED